MSVVKLMDCYNFDTRLKISILNLGDYTIGCYESDQNSPFAPDFDLARAALRQKRFN